MNLEANQLEIQGSEIHLQTLHRAFYEKADDHCLLWVNPAQGDPFENDPLVEDRRVRVPINHRNFDVKFAPYLVPIDLSKSRDADIFKQSIVMACDAWELDNLLSYRGQPIAGWIASEKSAQSLAQHWARNCHVHSVGRLSKLLRFHDPGVREWLWKELTSEQQGHLLGAAQFFIAVNRQQQLMIHSSQSTASPSSVSHENLADDAAGKLVLRLAQWEQLKEYATIHTAWLRCCVNDASFRQSIATAPGWEKPVLAALDFATRRGVHYQEDKELLAEHVLKFGTFYHHKEMLPVWEKTGSGESYGASIDGVFGTPGSQHLLQLQSNNLSTF